MVGGRRYCVITSKRLKALSLDPQGKAVRKVKEVPALLLRGAVEWITMDAKNAKAVILFLPERLENANYWR
ncbi:hypothetical protein E2C01_085663 [Portunus trituberculatus]|uniref:Uncharacterized protein n=1 Tax=Portunus trituberculatus TaxID=210409 RepID=A0A5B7J9I0_PORTR|nr:hypothetical protein [Portunus trituberculatus]